MTTAPDLLRHLRDAGFTLVATEGGIRVAPAGALSEDYRQAIRDHRVELMTMLADELTQASRRPSASARSCTACANLTVRQTCTEPVGAGLAEWFGIRWPEPGHAAACAAFRPPP